MGVDDLSLLSRTFQARIHEILYIPSFGKPGKPVDLNELTEFHIESLPMLIPNASKATEVCCQCCRHSAEEWAHVRFCGLKNTIKK